MSTPLALRFGELALALAGAKDRLRVAVAEELGRAAGSAIRDVLAAGTGRSVVPRSSYPARDSWDDRRWDDRDPWDDDRASSRGRYEEDEPAEDDDPPAGVPPAVTVGLGLWRWWLSRSGSWRAAWPWAWPLASQPSSAGHSSALSWRPWRPRRSCSHQHQ